MTKPFLDPSDTVVITDFDGTLLKKVVNGQRVPSLISELVKPHYLGEEGVKVAQALVTHYAPIEQDPSIAPAVKSALMQEWWEKTYATMKRFGVNRKMVEEICHSPFIQLREGVEEWFAYLTSHDTPIIIYSASGIGYDSIEYILQKHNIYTSNVRVCSNDIVFDEEGTFLTVKPPIIHSANKVGSTLIKLGYLTDPLPKSTCLLIGDSLDDIRMIEGINPIRHHSIIFADISVQKGTHLFDQVLPFDSSFAPILTLFKR